MPTTPSSDTPTRAYTQAMTGAETVQRRATPAAAFARAREMLLAGEKLDMARLASDINVSRATLYRWTGDRERLPADVVWVEVGGMIGFTPGSSPRSARSSCASPTPVITLRTIPNCSPTERCARRALARPQR